jgi:hypothetical protein
MITLLCITISYDNIVIMFLRWYDKVIMVSFFPLKTSHTVTKIANRKHELIVLVITPVRYKFVAKYKKSQLKITDMSCL